MSRVDIFVPCYNYARFLRACVTSALQQDGVQVRVLIIDDASSDETQRLSAQLAREDSRVAFTRHSVNQGHIATYNEGLGWVEGDYALLLSADDALIPGALARACRLMNDHPEVSFAYGRGIKTREIGREHV